MGPSGDTVARAREHCLRQYASCADECERALEGLRDEPSSRELRNELIVCAAVCRVAARALGDGNRIAGALVEYSVEICRRCAKQVGDAELPDRDAVVGACTDTAEAAATLLLIV